MNVYEIYEVDGVSMIRRNKYPRFTARITFNSPLGDFSDVEVTDQGVTALDLAKAMRKASEFLIKISRYGKKNNQYL